MNNDLHTEVMKNLGDVFSVGTLVGYFIGSLPIVATFLTILWTALRIYEMKTVQDWLRKKGVINGNDKAS